MAHIQSATMEVTQRGQELLQVRRERTGFFFTFLLWENIGQYLLSLSLARDRGEIEGGIVLGSVCSPSLLCENGGVRNPILESPKRERERFTLFSYL